MLVVDGVSIVKHEAVALLAGNPETSEPVGWWFAACENFDAWRTFLLRLRSRGANPEFVVSDGQKGLLKAVREVFPVAVTQRCAVHVHR
ncbi:transposase [Patescibacteria group bacterium]|nr:transposase [Patescibacteria group bacterium]